MACKKVKYFHIHLGPQRKLYCNKRHTKGYTFDTASAVNVHVMYSHGEGPMHILWLKIYLPLSGLKPSHLAVSTD